MIAQALIALAEEKGIHFEVNDEKYLHFAESISREKLVADVSYILQRGSRKVFVAVCPVEWNKYLDFIMEGFLDDTDVTKEEFIKDQEAYYEDFSILSFKYYTDDKYIAGWSASYIKEEDALEFLHEVQDGMIEFLQEE